MPAMKAEHSPTNFWSLQTGTSAFLFLASVTTTNCQGCRFAPEGARRVASSICISSSLGISLSLYFRMLLLFWIAVVTSN